jgi:UDP-N-acetylmuramate--alanine ligase
MIKIVHFVGIKGVGMTALAVLMKQAGLSVTGSDLSEQFITDVTLQQAGIIPLVGFSPEHVNEADLVITTGAHGGYDNPEVISAKEKGKRVMSLAEAMNRLTGHLWEFRLPVHMGKQQRQR